MVIACAGSANAIAAATIATQSHRSLMLMWPARILRAS
jgi:hypothetical protein